MLEGWELTLLGQAPRGSALYKVLLPQGRETLTTGSIDEQIDAVRDFGARLVELYSMVGLGMTVLKLTPADVDTLFNGDLLRQPEQEIPAAPASTLWTPLARLLSTTALPAGATRLEAWREGPGGMPERLAVGETGAVEVLIPATVTFDSGDTYQLWLTARNSRGTSEPGPVTTWVAP